MEIESNIDEIIHGLEKKGSNIKYLSDLKKNAIEIAKKDFDLSDSLNELSEELKSETEDYLSKTNTNGNNYISGISSCIYLPDFNSNGEYKLILIGGTRERNKNLKIDANTLFDIASITKLYTLILAFKLEELGLINLNDKIKDVNSDFQNLEDFTFNDLIRLHGELRTNDNIIQASTKEEAYEMLKTLYLSSNSREENKYTDFGAIVIGYTIEKIISKKLGKKMTFDEIMSKYLLEPLNLNHTTFNPKKDNVSGNGGYGRLVHDPKSRILGGAVGSAGIFTTSDDLAKLARNLYSVNYVNQGLISKNHLKKFGEITFPNTIQSNKGNLGIYVKHPLGYTKTYTPPEFSNGSFSHEGWTGSVATFDPHNLIHQNILVNAIFEDENKSLIKSDKLIGFGTMWEEYQRNITKNAMLMYVVKKYYNKYCGVKENIDVIKQL